MYVIFQLVFMLIYTSSQRMIKSKLLVLSYSDWMTFPWDLTVDYPRMYLIDTDLKLITFISFPGYPSLENMSPGSKLLSFVLLYKAQFNRNQSRCTSYMLRRYCFWNINWQEHSAQLHGDREFCIQQRDRLQYI